MAYRDDPDAVVAVSDAAVLAQLPATPPAIAPAAPLTPPDAAVDRHFTVVRSADLIGNITRLLEGPDRGFHDVLTTALMSLQVILSHY